MPEGLSFFIHYFFFNSFNVFIVEGDGNSLIVILLTTLHKEMLKYADDGKYSFSVF